MESGIYVMAGAFVGGLFSFLSARRAGYVAGMEKELQRNKNRHILACQQIKAYYHLEALYVTEMAKLTGQAEQTIQIKFRNDVEVAGNVRPTWTARDADNEIMGLDSK